MRGKSALHAAHSMSPALAPPQSRHCAAKLRCIVSTQLVKKFSTEFDTYPIHAGSYNSLNILSFSNFLRKFKSMDTASLPAKSSPAAKSPRWSVDDIAALFDLPF